MAEEVATPDEQASSPVAPVVVARWVQLVMLPLAVLALYALPHAAGVVLLVFIVAAVVALILNPLVALLQRARLPRTLAVIAVYGVFFIAIPLIGFLRSGPLSDQATSFALILNPLVALLQRARLPRTLAVIAVYGVFFIAIPLIGFLRSGPLSDQATSFALILNPLVALLQRARLPRTLAVIAVYGVFFIAIPLIGFLLSGPVSDQATSFAQDVPGLVRDASSSLDDVQEFFDDKGVDVQIKGQTDSALASLQRSVVEGSGEIVAVTGELLGRLIELSFYVILVVVLSIYMLIYGSEIGRLVRQTMPAGGGSPAGG